MAIVTTGWKFPGTVVNGVSGETGTNDWTSPTNISADDGNEASSAFAGTRTRTLRASNFGFTSSDIPAGATINGIEVRIERRESDANRISDASLFLVPDASGGNVSGRVGSNKADTATKWPTSAAVASYGSSSDGWSAGLTRAQVISANFAVDFEAQSTLGGIGYVDYLQVRITWELASITGDANIIEAGDTVIGGSAYMPALALDFITSETPDPRIVFSGGANGTRVNAAGQIVAASAPRYDYDPVTREAKGLLIEEARTNYLIQSEFATGLPASRGGSVSAVAFAGLISGTGLAFGYDGVTSAYFYVTNYAVPASSLRVISVFVRMDDGGAPVFGSNGTHTPANDFVFNLGNLVLSPTAANGGKIEDYGGGLYRVSLAVTTNASPSSNCGVIKYNDNSPRTFTCSGIMVEAGTAPSSYIATGAAQVTRTTDSAVISGGDFSAWYNQDVGTLIAAFDRNPGLDSTDRSAVGLDTGSAASRIILYSPTVGRAIGVTGGVTSFFFSNLGAVTAGGRHAIGLAYVLDDFAACMNGGPLSTDASGAVPAANRMVIGGGSGVSALNGHVRWLRYYNERLPNAALQALTTLITGTGSLAEANDNAAGTGRVKVKGTAAIVEGDDVAAGSGETGIHLTTPRGRIAVGGVSRLSNRIAR
ncbi:hypothetical protein HY78_00885 [Rhizorhabdus wittichii DC-6]|nr:hypothetical protein HY78_00885 [Rhizorhabdus wittichii DC-6]